MSSVYRTLLFLSGFIAFSTYAQETLPKRYNLFRPVPASEMRPFSLDRPDVTESPMTVDAGHFQFEGDLFKSTQYVRGRSAGTLNIMNGLYKIGLSDSWDFHLGVELYNIYINDEKETVAKGYGNTTFRLKYNFWGNNGNTRTALGMIPYVTLPTSPVDEDVVFGVGFPFAYSINDNLGAGAQFQTDFAPDEEGRYTISYLQTIVLGGKLIGNLDFYVEGVGIFSGLTTYSANGGLIYNVNNQVKVDVATNLGLVEEAPTRIYVGLSFRI